MAFFVETKKIQTQEPISKPEHLEIDMLVSAKRMGLSFQELNMFSFREFMLFAQSYIGKDEARDATQDDIDKFYSTM